MNKKFDNLRKMKEYRLAMLVKDALNDYGFGLCSLCRLHPTDAPDLAAEPLQAVEGVPRGDGR